VHSDFPNALYTYVVKKLSRAVGAVPVNLVERYIRKDLHGVTRQRAAALIFNAV
jgi:hypothetical protein